MLCNKSKAFFFTVSHTAPLVDQVLYYVFPLSPTYMRPSCPWEASQQPARCCRVLHASANSEPLAEAPPVHQAAAASCAPRSAQTPRWGFSKQSTCFIPGCHRKFRSILGCLRPATSPTWNSWQSTLLKVPTQMVCKTGCFHV